MPNERRPSVSEVLRRHCETWQEGIHTMVPAYVTAYDGGSKGKCSVKPVVKNAFLDEEEDRQVESMPVISGVPVQFPGGAEFAITFPISDGNLLIDGITLPATIGTLIFSERSLDAWLSGNGGEVDPGIDHMHAISDGCFMPGLHTFGKPLKSMPNNRMVAGYNGGPSVINFHTGDIRLVDDTQIEKITLGTSLDMALNNYLVTAMAAAAASLQTAGADAIFDLICPTASAAIAAAAATLNSATIAYTSARTAAQNFQSNKAYIGRG